MYISSTDNNKCRKNFGKAESPFSVSQIKWPTNSDDDGGRTIVEYEKNERIYLGETFVLSFVCSFVRSFTRSLAHSFTNY